MTRALPRLLGLVLALACGCGRVADASGEPEATEGTDGEDGEDEPGTGESDGGEEPPAEPEVDAPTAEAEIDAAIAAARAHGEEDRLALGKQRAELDALAKELDARLGGIEKLEQRLDALVGVGKVAEERRRERLDVLANLLATMPPAAAATMLAQMSEIEAQDLVLAVAQTDKRKAAKLIATMPSPRAAAIGQGYLRRDPKALAPAPAVDTPAAPASPSLPAPAPITSEPSEPAPESPASPAKPTETPDEPQESSP